MSRPRIFLFVILALVAGGAAWWWPRPDGGRAGPAETRERPVTARGPEKSVPTEAPSRRAGPVPSAANPALAAAEKAARVEKIKHDYEEITARFASEFSAAGPAFPGGLNAYLRQLALLDREKWKDLATVLAPRELEDLAMTDTRAGRLVQQRLGATGATEEQRRAVFRLQAAFDDKYALTFDLTPPTLLARETERQALQERIVTLLGPALGGVWLGGEGADYGNFQAFTAQQGLPAEAALDLWRVKNYFTRQRLAIVANASLSAAEARAAQAALTRETQQRVIGVLGANALQLAGSDVLGWLPPK